MRQDVRYTTDFDISFIDLDKLVKELHKEEIPVESAIDLVNEEFTNEFQAALDDLEVSATCYFSRGCFYLPNGDPGFPDESGIEDVGVEAVSFLGKKLDITDCLTSKMLDHIENVLWEKFREE